jgi:hypothetical protein
LNGGLRHRLHHQQTKKPALSPAFVTHLVQPEHQGRRSRALEAFSSEVDTGSREENASRQKPKPPFRFNRNG